MANGSTGPRPSLSCPLCGFDTFPASEYVTKAAACEGMLQGWIWWDGEDHDCSACGAKLLVEADGETASLIEVSDE